MPEGMPEVPVPVSAVREPIPLSIPVEEVHPPPVPVTTPEQAPTPHSQETPHVQALKNMVSNLNIPFEKLPEPIKNLYQRLISQGNKIPLSQYKEGFNTFLQGILQTKDLLGENQQKILEGLQKTLAGEKVSMNDIQKAFQTTIQQLPPEQQASAEQAMHDIQEETAKPQDQQDKRKIEGGFEKLFNFFKILGGVILALLGFGVYRGMTSEMGGGRGMQQQ